MPDERLRVTTKETWYDSEDAYKISYYDNPLVGFVPKDSVEEETVSDEKPKEKLSNWPPNTIYYCGKCSSTFPTDAFHGCGMPPKAKVECSSKEGVKYDQDKLKWHLLPFKALEGMVKVLTFGASKYSENGWRTVPNARDRYLSAMLRHLCAIQMGEKVDSESGLRHIDHLLCNAAFLAELED